MNKLGFLAILQVFGIFSTTIAYCRETRVHELFSKIDPYKPATDTIYQIDTVYQYVIIYDTLYYYDSPQETDTTAVMDTIIEHTDSTVVINNRLTLNLKEKETVYYNQDLEFIENPAREFEDLPDESRTKQQTSFTPPVNSQTREKKRQKQPESNTKEGKNLINIEPVTHYLKDTIFFYDTLVTHEMVYDTVFFRNSDANADTTVTQSTEFEKMGKLVMAIETVKFTVNRRESIFVEKNTKSVYKPHHSQQNVNTSRKKSKTQSAPSHSSGKWWRHESRYAEREFPDNNVDYTTLVSAAISVFEPEITFTQENDNAEEYVECLNNNTSPETSWGGSLTYTYFRNNQGFEMGLGYSKNNFSFNHFFDEADVDTSFFWEYYEKSIYDYDTTWYLNIDTLLQTGDTLLVPSVDSTLIQVTDSIQQPDYDTTFIKKSSKYNYSYSYLEIPIIGRFMLFDGKISGQLALGVIPSFLVSKSGKMPSSETGTMVEANEISYDYSFSLSGYGAITLMYKLNGNYSFFVEPYIRRNLFSSLRNDQFQVRNNTWGARFGLSYTLFSTKNKKFR